MARAGSPGTIRPGDPTGSCKGVRGGGGDGPGTGTPQPGRHKHLVKHGLGQRMLCSPSLPPPPAPKRCFSPCRHREGGEASIWGRGWGKASLVEAQGGKPRAPTHGGCRSLPQPRHGSISMLRAKSPGLDALGGFGVGAGGGVLLLFLALRQAQPRAASEGPSQARAPRGGGETHAAGPGTGQAVGRTGGGTDEAHGCPFP